METQSAALCGGNTPTCVGKTVLLDQDREMQRKHPHLRGEDLIPASPFKNTLETPPPAWGRPERAETPLNSPRNTPTCVGKTPATVIWRLSLRKHPHLRGEDNNFILDIIFQPETPPPAWGRHLAQVGSGHLCRNTPTCVGKTACCSACR